MYKQKSLKSNFIYSALYQLLALLLPLIVTPYVSRVLGPDGIGEYSYTLSIVTYFAMIGVMGTTTHGQLVIAKHRNSKQRLSELFWGILISRIILSSIIIILYLIFIYNTSDYQITFLVLIILLVAQLFDISWFFQGLEEFKIIVFRNFVIRILGVLLIFLFVKDHNDLVYYIVILQGSTLVGNISLWPYLKKNLEKIEFKNLEIWVNLKESIQYFIPAIATSIYSVLDKSMIGFFSENTVENGYYEQAQKIQQIALTFITTLSLVTMPRFAFLFSQSQNDEIIKLYRRTQKIVLMLSLPIMFGIMSISNNLVPWFLGEDFEPCIELLIIFSPLLVIVGLNNTIGRQCLMATSKQKQYNKGVIIGAFVNFTINIVLIPILYSKGAAIATVIAEIAILLVFLHHSREYVNIRNLLSDSRLYFLTSLVMGVIVYLIGFIGGGASIILLQICSGFLFYVIFLFLFKDELLYALLKDLKNKYVKI